MSQGARTRPNDPRISAALIEWHARRGRHDLPWQTDRTPYRVWVSEIMLQQTQVATVIPYYQRFMERFPTVRSLADAPVDDVLHLWAGLGYYARARNMQRAAIRVRDEFGGEFPERFEDVASLPGIGRSTAGAILALSRGQRFPILDGNVRRVLSRYHGIDGSPALPQTLEWLWQLSDHHTPEERVDTYTQAIMDLGATLCVRRRPLCTVCPIADGCVARQTGRQHEIPAPRQQRARRLRRVVMIVAMRHDGGVLLQRRPETGIWGGLWCLPEFDDLDGARCFMATRLLGAALEPQPLAEIDHAFTHFDLAIAPVLVRCAGPAAVMDDGEYVWYNPMEPMRIGLPAPIRTLLRQLSEPAMPGERAAG